MSAHPMHASTSKGAAHPHAPPLPSSAALPPPAEPLLADGDIILLSDSSEAFYANSLTLRTASGFFQSLLSLPQPTPSEGIISIPTYEPSTVLRPLLNLIHGLPTPRKLSDLDEITTILALADRWGCHGVISYLRPILSSPDLLTPSNALKLYVISCHYQWAHEARLAALHTFDYDLYAEEHEPILSELSSRDYMALLRLHRSRRDQLKGFIDDPQRFTAGNVNPFHCGLCSTPIDNSSWRQLKIILFEKMDRKPQTSGFETGLQVETGDDEDLREAADQCWKASCLKKSCASLNYDKKATMKQIAGCADRVVHDVVLDWA